MRVRAMLDVTYLVEVEVGPDELPDDALERAYAEGELGTLEDHMFYDVEEAR